MTKTEAKKLLLQAIDLYQQGELDKVIDILCKIQREDSPELYAKAQFILGGVLGERGDTEGEIIAYRNVTHEDSPEQYAKAQLNLGVVLAEQGEMKEAITAWSNITREDSPESYAQAQFNLGIALEEQGDIKGAISAWSNITRADSPEPYAQAQFNLGVTLKEQGDTEGAISAWRNITREDSPEQYAKAQFNLGNILRKQKNIEGAIDAWHNITRKDFPEAYAKAQFNLGVVLNKQGKTERAIKAYYNIIREDAPISYARSQLNLGVLLENKGNIEDALVAYNNIIHNDCPRAFAGSRLNLGFIYGKRGEVEREIAVYKSIEREDFGSAYKEGYYEIESALKSLNYPLATTISLLKIRRAVATLIRNLLVRPEKQDNKKPKVAHYTSPAAAYTVIAENSPFRLNPIKGVNDPSEGLVLYQYMRNYYEQKNNAQPLGSSTAIPNQTMSVFISCFTFNHDSLNQFRLYGKEEGREASGISLVVDQRFFSDENLFGVMATSMNASIENNFTGLEKELVLDKQDKLSDEPQNNFLEKLTLYRCLYIDPRSGYLSIAQRDKATFYAETWYDKKTADYKIICDQAEKDWKSYLEEISELTKVIKDEFTQLADAVAEILKTLPGNDILDTLAFILQPLRYLVKHAAFQEEQECRMLYITSLEDTRIKSEWDNKRMYLEYATPVKEALDKIYLSPGAQPHEDFFKKELPDLAKEGKIRHSRNPFRNK